MDLGTAGGAAAESAQLTTIDSKLGDIKGYTDTLETLIAATNTALTTLQGYVDGLEALDTTRNSALTTIQGYIDGLETLIAATNTALTTLQGYVDGLETLVGALNPTTFGVPYTQSIPTSGGTGSGGSTQLTAIVVTTGVKVVNTSSGGQTITIGKSSAAAAWPLVPGQAEFFPCRNANEVYAIATGTAGTIAVLPL